MAGHTKRYYNGDPLAYYLSHPEKFQGYKGRYQLAVGDSGMHRALLRAGQIEEAFPETDELKVKAGRKGGKRKDLSEEEILEVIGAYETFDGNANEASRNLPYVAQTFINHWREAGLEIRKRGQRD